MRPSEYFARQCHVGASFLPPRDCDRRAEVGVDPGEIQQIVAGNAARVYGFDLTHLAPLAARVGPAKAEIAQPIEYASLPAAARKCPGFSPDNQRANV